MFIPGVLVCFNSILLLSSLLVYSVYCQFVSVFSLGLCLDSKVLLFVLGTVVVYGYFKGYFQGQRRVSGVWC